MGSSTPNFFHRILVLKQSLVRMLEFLLIAAVTVLVLDVLWGVISRYLLGEQGSWTEELARVLLIWVSLLGGALAYSAKVHLGLDLFVSSMDRDTRKKVMIVTDIIIMLFAIFVLIIGGGSLVKETLRLEQMMMALGIAKGYVYLAVPISGLFFLIFSIESLFERFFPEKIFKEEELAS